ncbi:MAG: GWxTD domain-containing protein [Acidobacteriota bacterium]
MKHLMLSLCILANAANLLAVAEKDLPEKYRKWFQEEVVYIITPLEKQVFLSFTSDKDRDFFIEAFWAQRDPTPGTPTNEFRDEHYRRINYANTYFIDSPAGGWRTDRGRVYIILGKPDQVERFEETLTIVPTEVWFYRGKTEFGFPSGFNVIFFKRHGYGEYKLYHPGSDGPVAFMRHYDGAPANTEEAYEKLKEYEPVLAEYSLNLLVGQTSDRMGAALSSEVLLANIAAYPQKLIDPRYAEKVSRYRGQIEADYSLSYVECRYIVRVTRAPSGTYFVNYAIEPKTLSVDQYEKKYFTSYKIYGKIEDDRGRTVYEFNKTQPMEFDEATLKLLKGGSLCLTDLFPAIPGKYKLTLLVKNIVSKEFSDFETSIEIPAAAASTQLLDPLLSGLLKTTPQDAILRPFQYGSTQPELRPQAIFLRGTALSATFQVAGPTDGVSVVATIRKEAQEVSKTERTLQSISLQTHYNLMLPTGDLPAGEYAVRFDLTGTGGAVLSSKEVPFSISPVAAVPTPWVYSKVLPADKSYIYELIVADQYARREDDDAAFAALEAGEKNYPDVVEFKIGLARLRLQKKEYEKVVQTLEPIVAGPELKQPEAYLYLATAQQAMRRFEPAIENYNRYMSSHGTDHRVLNAIGDCYYASGQIPAAIKTWQTSLQLVPDQPELKSRLAQLGQGGEAKK